MKIASAIVDQQRGANMPCGHCIAGNWDSRRHRPGNGDEIIKPGQEITVSCCEGESGRGLQWPDQIQGGEYQLG